MQKPLTGEARERAIEKILSECPSLTREMLEEWATQGRLARPGEIEEQLEKLYREGLRKKIPHPDPSIPGLVIRKRQSNPSNSLAQVQPSRAEV